MTKCYEHISIHALLAESDRSWMPIGTIPANFNPRSPCGERRLILACCQEFFNFNPRSPCGERPLFPSF